ncbi:hypothetical protein HELRODRAFT_175935 [Helobdella robusta]|uniref:Uncharacterized protein n=1 Tax=Helobdella robusta TaxID=6412 RepID=T1F9X5_HELRO|nr:hypothetical protein HELRODRAFT_175935 [Helobdella robusta]ESO00497.1 hypothetical protein HELRODRAFT_175935 [Helobdella robusta]
MHQRDKVDTPLPGLKLPKTVKQWATANAYFHSQRTNLPNVNNIDNFANSLQSVIYDYFASNYGTLETKTISSVDQNKPINKLKKELKQLKVLGRNNHNYDLQIKALNKEIRSKLSALKAQKFRKNSDITNQLQQKLWPTCKKLFNLSNSSLPLFNVTECEKFFKNILNNQLTKKFRLPNWIYTPPDPSFPCSVDPPTYNDILSIIRKCKSRASLCPLDLISIIIFKKCPIIRTILHQLLEDAIWERTIFKSSFLGPFLFEVSSVSTKLSCPVALKAVKKICNFFSKTQQPSLQDCLCAAHRLERDGSMVEGAWYGYCNNWVRISPLIICNVYDACNKNRTEAINPNKETISFGKEDSKINKKTKAWVTQIFCIDCKKWWVIQIFYINCNKC